MLLEFGDCASTLEEGDGSPVLAGAGATAVWPPYMAQQETATTLNGIDIRIIANRDAYKIDGFVITVVRARGAMACRKRKILY